MKRLRLFARTMRDRFHFIMRFHASRRKWVAVLYYGFANQALSREAMAVAAGQTRYFHDKTGEAGSPYLLRRSIHRLEKGLIMRPRRPTFAADYIGDAVAMYARSATAAPSAELTWAGDVLSAYFEVVVADDPRIAVARTAFLAIPRSQGESPEATSVPYIRDLDAAPSVDFDAFMALTRRRRSVRWYKDEQVPRELIDRALVSAAQAPSACNRQPYLFRIFDDPVEAQRITAIPMGTKGFSQQVPAVAVLIGQLRAYPAERDRHAIYIDGALAAMSFMFALETLGLASCPINWPDHEPYESRMKKTLSLEADERVIMLISFGFPDPEGKVPFSAKRDLELVRVYQ